MGDWSEWRPFPDPRQGGYLVAPLGPGLYELRRIASKKLVLLGCGGCCAFRMSSLLPAPIGAGTRNNAKKRSYVLEYLADIEYRTMPCDTSDDARRCEREFLDSGGYEFGT